MAKKFKRGTFVLKEGVTDLAAFEEPIMTQLKEIIAWAEDNSISLSFGTSEDNTYLCEYDVKAQTAQLCKGYVSELKAMLKKLFPKAYVGVEWSGNYLG